MPDDVLPDGRPYIDWRPLNYDATIKALRAENEHLKARIIELEQQVKDMEDDAFNAAVERSMRE